jgi:hypothetical protein
MGGRVSCKLTGALCFVFGSEDFDVWNGGRFRYTLVVRRSSRCWIDSARATLRHTMAQ